MSNLKLYSTNDANNVINKELELKLDLDVTLRSDFNFYNPIIKLRIFSGFRNTNYCEIDGFKYYLENYDISGNVVTFNFKYDYLENNKDAILDSEFRIIKYLESGDYGEVNLSIIEAKFEEIELDYEFSGNKYILNVFGG